MTYHGMTSKPNKSGFYSLELVNYEINSSGNPPFSSNDSRPINLEVFEAGGDAKGDSNSSSLADADAVDKVK